MNHKAPSAAFKMAAPPHQPSVNYVLFFLKQMSYPHIQDDLGDAEG